MEAQITAGMKTPVLSSRAGPEVSAGDKGRKRESEALKQTLNTERNEQVSQIPLVPFKVQPKNVLSVGGGGGGNHLICFVTITWKKLSVFEFVI